MTVHTQHSSHTAKLFLMASKQKQLGHQLLTFTFQLSVVASSFLLISLSLASSVGESISASSHFANSLFLPSWSMQLHIQTKHSWSSSLVFGKRAINPMGLMSSMQSECCYPCSLRPLLVRSNYTPAGTAVSFWFQQGCELSPGVVRCLLGFLMLVTSVYIHRYTRLLNKDTCWTVRGVSPPNAQ